MSDMDTSRKVLFDIHIFDASRAIDKLDKFARIYRKWILLVCELQPKKNNVR